MWYDFKSIKDCKSAFGCSCSWIGADKCRSTCSEPDYYYVRGASACATYHIICYICMQPQSDSILNDKRYDERYWKKTLTTRNWCVPCSHSILISNSRTALRAEKTKQNKTNQCHTAEETSYMNIFLISALVSVCCSLLRWA